MDNNGRFKRVYSHGNYTDGMEILVDTETGVNYLWKRVYDSGGLTVLLDAEGKPVITK